MCSSFSGRPTLLSCKLASSLVYFASFPGPKLLRGGGGKYSYLRVLPDEFFFKSVVIKVDFKRNKKFVGQNAKT